MYEINDTILYGLDVCRIAEIAERKVGGERAEYYTLQPIYDEKTVIYVPTNNERAAAKMRRVLTEREVMELIRSMSDENIACIEDETARRDRFREILSSGDRSEMVRLLKTLYLRRIEKSSQGKKLHVIDEKFVKDTEKALQDEFAYVLNIRQDQVLPFIESNVALIEGEK